MGFPSTCTTGDLAKLLGVSSRRVLQLVEEGVVAKTARDQFETARSIQAYIAFSKKAAATESGRYAGLSRERAGLVKIQRLRAQIELDRQLELVVDIPTAVAAVAKELVLIRNRFLGLATKVAPRGILCRTAPELYDLIYRETTAILTELSAPERLVRKATRQTAGKATNGGNVDQRVE